MLPVASVAATDRAALVLGMADYQYLPKLDNTRNDALRMAETLEGIGFDVTLGIDVGAEDMTRMLEGFAFRAEVADLALHHADQLAGDDQR